MPYERSYFITQVRSKVHSGSEEPSRLTSTMKFTGTRLSKSIRTLAKLAFTYALGDIFSKGLNYLLLPLYTRYLSPDGYGIIAIVEMLRVVLGLVLSLGTSGAILRFVHVYHTQEDQKSFLGTTWVFLIVVPGLITCALILFGPLYTPRVFPGIEFKPFIFNTLWTAYITSAFITPLTTLFRARDQARYYVGLNILNAMVISGLTIYHLVFQGKGAAGWVQAQLEAAVIMGALGLIILLKEVRLSFQWRVLQPIMLYSLPLIPHFLSHWILSVSDRLILQHFAGLVSLGVYTLGYQFGQGFQVIESALNNALVPLFGRSSRMEQEAEILPRITTFYIFGILFVGVGVALLGPQVILTIFPDDYHSGAPIVPWVVLGYIALGIYYIPVNHLAIMHGKTKTVPLASLSAALVNLVLNLIFIPHYGPIAAAINTTVGYGVLAILMLYFAHSLAPLPLETGRIYKLVGAVFIAYVLGRLTFQFTPTINLLIGFVITGSLPVILWLLRFWTVEEMSVLKHLLRHSANQT